MSKCKHKGKHESLLHKNIETGQWTCSKCGEAFPTVREALAVGNGLSWRPEQAVLTDQEKLDIAIHMVNAARDVPSGWDQPEGSYTGYECSGCSDKNHKLDEARLLFEWDDLKRISNTIEIDNRLRGLIQELRREVIYRTEQPYPAEDYLSILTRAVEYVKAIPIKRKT